MSWNGAGLFNRVHSWAADALNALNISSSRMDAEFENYKTGLENCVTRNGENQASANLPMGGFRHTAVGTASARDQYAQVGQIQDTSFVWGGTAGGTANALTISITPAVTALVAGQTVRFVTGGSANSGAATLATNGLAATAIVKDGNTALVAGDLPANSLIEAVYNGTNYRLNRTSATSLLSGATMTDVVHTTGPENVGGPKTFTDNIVISKASARLDLRDTAQALPAGLWGWQCADNKLYLFRNTHVSGGFGSLTIPVQFDSSDDTTFLGKVSAAAATVSTELITKAQLDAKVYGGRITNGGTASVDYGPSGWSVSRSAVGTTTVTHNLGTTNYAVVTVVRGSQFVSDVSSEGTNSFVVLTWNASTSALTDTNYDFVLARN